MQKNGIVALHISEPDFPERLRHCPDGPTLLYYKGSAQLNQEHLVAIVGTRNATEYGQRITEQIIEELAKMNILVVSGLAYGIDIRAHQMAIQNHIPTIGVLAHGLDRIYPHVHRNVAHRMMDNGGLITEFPSQTNPDRENFPRRNCIIAGLCDATIVIEAASKGGALITADLANGYNRDVFAVPGFMGSGIFGRL